MNSVKSNYKIRVRIWIDSDDGPFLGNGRILLLKRIDETGSITNAAKSMKMSYRQAWQLVEDMNNRASEPLVEKIHGGKNGSGAFLSSKGIEMIQKFHQLEDIIHKTILEIEDSIEI